MFFRVDIVGIKFDSIGVNCQKALYEAHNFKLMRPKADESRAFCVLIDVLKRIGHWNILNSGVGVIDP